VPLAANRGQGAIYVRAIKTEYALLLVGSLLQPLIGCRPPDLSLSSLSSADTASFQTGTSGYSGTVDGLITSSGGGIGANDFTSASSLVMNNTTGGYEARALVKWSNISLPAGATVTGAQVSFTWEDFAGGHDMKAYYLKNSWDTSAKWAPRTSTLNWNTPGAKGVGTDITSSTPAFEDTNWTASGVSTRPYTLSASVVQGWIDTPSTNQGLILTNATANKQLFVYTSRNTTAAYRPQLTITYTTGGGGADAAVDSASNCFTVATGTWNDDSFTAQTSFTAEFDATPSAAGVDEVMGFSQGSAAQSFTNLQAAARFATTGVIEARNAGAYAADNTITYSAGTTYHFRFVFDDIRTKTYSVFVTPSGGSEVTLGSNYAFRTGAPAVTALDDLATEAGTGTLQVCNLSVSSMTYNGLVLADNPVAFWGMTAGGTSETDLTGNGRTGTYVNSTPTTSSMPNGDTVAVFNGSNQYLTVASNASLSIPTTHKMTWEAWIRPTTLEFPTSPNHYVNFMGKCEHYSPTCEWEARMYDTTTTDQPPRYNRLSAYAFNSSAGFGAGADFQPTSGLIQAGHWYHVVGEYTTLTTPSDCSGGTPPRDPTTYPGQIDIWVDGVKWDQAVHAPTGCMDQYTVTPVANNSSFRIGTVEADSFFEGAIGKVAIYNYLLTQDQITAHYEAMTGLVPGGTCGDTCTLTNP